MTVVAPRPIARAERITNLDAVRGVATLGILVMNAVAFALPAAAYFNLDAAGSESWLDWLIGILGEVFVDQKTMALFSLLFGAGIVLFAERTEAKGRRPLPLSLWRNALLLGIGIAHTVLWDGDVLTIYALCAPVLLLLRKRSPRTLFISGTVLVLLSAVNAVIAQTQISDSGAGLGDYWYVDGGPIGDAAGLFLIADFFLRSLGMMLIGVALYRLGILQGKRSDVFYRRMAAFGLGVGLPLAFAGVLIQIVAGWSAGIAVIGEAPNTLATVPLALGYLGVITLWNKRETTGLGVRIQAVGRMALTNYLMHTIIGIAFFRGFDVETTRTGIAAFIVTLWAAQLVWSKWWLERFRFGPFEWLWRCATYRKFQPIRRVAKADPSALIGRSTTN